MSTPLPPPLTRPKKKKINRVCNTRRARTWQQVRQLTAKMHEEHSRHEMFQAAEQLFACRIHAPHRMAAGEELCNWVCVAACSALYRSECKHTESKSEWRERNATAGAKATCHCHAILNEQRTLRMVTSPSVCNVERLRHDAHAPTHMHNSRFLIHK